jgi:Na+-translocating ferredoxin:NAD+ oxidoreductase subunit C
MAAPAIDDAVAASTAAAEVATAGSAAELVVAAEPLAAAPEHTAPVAAGADGACTGEGASELPAPVAVPVCGGEHAASAEEQQREQSVASAAASNNEAASQASEAPAVAEDAAAATTQPLADDEPAPKRARTEGTSSSQPTMQSNAAELVATPPVPALFVRSPVVAAPAAVEAV